jgi:hypothetical protein
VSPLDGVYQQVLGVQVAQREVESTMSSLATMMTHLQAESYAKVRFSTVFRLV